MAERRAGGEVVMRSTEPLGEYAPSMAHAFRVGTQRHPERMLAAHRERDGWTAYRPRP